MKIERIQGTYPPGRSNSTSYKDLVWTVATASDESLDLPEQTSQTLDSIEANLKELGSDKTKIVSAQVFLSNIDDKPIMDKVWREWIGSNPANWPQRACLGVNLGGHWLIEVTVTAVRPV
ncbi:MAG: RidA family protein [Gammaproteobacteria bacterium]|nr:RidA family protein [Gammaproteobacteria bacterium]